MPGSATWGGRPRPGSVGVLLLTLLLPACPASLRTAARPGGDAASPSPAPQATPSLRPGLPPSLRPGLPPGKGPAAVQAIVPGPLAPVSFATATVSCPAGSVLTGGGIRAGVKGGGTPSPSLHFVGAFPGAPPGEAPPGGTSGVAWTAIGATGAQPVPDATTAAFGICDREPAAPGSGRVPQVVIRSTAGPVAAASSARATAACPDGTVLLGGGANAGLRKGWPPPPSLHVTASFPSDAGGNPATASGARPNAWTAVASTGGAALTGAATAAYALCGTRPATGQMVVKSAIGPSGAATSFGVTARCPDGRVLLFGGASTGLTQGGNKPPQGLHMTGTFPSDAAGHPVDGAAATAWTAVAEAGGLMTLGTRTTAFAVCSSQ